MYIYVEKERKRGSTTRTRREMLVWQICSPEVMSPDTHDARVAGEDRHAGSDASSHSLHSIPKRFCIGCSWVAP